MITLPKRKKEKPKKKKTPSLHWKKWATLGVSVKLRNDYADYDYLDKLSREDLKWLKGFHREYINADFQHKYKKLITGKKARKAVYDLNNSRNRDLYNIAKWSHNLYLNETVNQPQFKEDYENCLFEGIEIKRMNGFEIKWNRLVRKSA